MKNGLSILLLGFQMLVFGQSDTLIKRDSVIELGIPILGCDHGHICCAVSCKCCPNSTHRLKLIEGIQLSRNPDYSQTIYPEGDSLTYDQYVGEFIAGFALAEGWREDTINGGYNKIIYDNPYLESIEFNKDIARSLTAYRYKNGKLYTGKIEDTLDVRFTPSKIRGYLNGVPYYETVNLTMIFRANCVNGLLQGRGILCGFTPQFGIYNNMVLSECNFEDGEIVGVCKYWDLNSINFEVKNGKIYHHESQMDYFEFKKLLELTEVTYAKGSKEWIQRTTYIRNKETGETKAKTLKNKN